MTIRIPWIKYFITQIPAILHFLQQCRALIEVKRTELNQRQWLHGGWLSFFLSSSVSLTVCRYPPLLVLLGKWDGALSIRGKAICVAKMCLNVRKIGNLNTVVQSSPVVVVGSVYFRNIVLISQSESHYSPIYLRV